MLQLGPQSLSVETKVRDLLQQWSALQSRTILTAPHETDAVAEIARTTNHYLHAFLGSQQCDCCPDPGLVEDWEEILANPHRFLTLVDMYVRPSYPPRVPAKNVARDVLRQHYGKNIPRIADLSPKERMAFHRQVNQEARRILDKRRREGGKLRTHLKRELLLRAEEQVLLEGIHDIIPGQVWN